MSIQLADNFSLRGQYPLDSRFISGTRAQFLTFDEREAYDGLIKLCTEDSCLYMYDSTYVDAVTGHFKPIGNEKTMVEHLRDFTEKYGALNIFDTTPSNYADWNNYLTDAQAQVATGDMELHARYKDSYMAVINPFFDNPEVLFSYVTPTTVGYITGSANELGPGIKIEKEIGKDFIVSEDLATITQPFPDTFYYQSVDTDDHINGLYIYDFENSEWKSVGGFPVDDITVVINDDKKLESYAIIDCVEFPTTDIKENVIYRQITNKPAEEHRYALTDDAIAAGYVMSDSGLEDTTTGDVVSWSAVNESWENTYKTLFVESDTGDLYRWKNEGSSEFNIAYGGIDIEAGDLYYYKNDTWYPLADDDLFVTVKELPTEDIELEKLYRVIGVTITDIKSYDFTEQAIADGWTANKDEGLISGDGITVVSWPDLVLNKDTYINTIIEENLFGDIFFYKADGIEEARLGYPKASVAGIKYFYDDTWHDLGGDTSIIDLGPSERPSMPKQNCFYRFSRDVLRDVTLLKLTQEAIDEGWTCSTTGMTQSDITYSWSEVEETWDSYRLLFEINEESGYLYEFIYDDVKHIQYYVYPSLPNKITIEYYDLELDNWQVVYSSIGGTGSDGKIGKYKDLLGKPTLNGVEINDAKTSTDYKIIWEGNEAAYEELSAGEKQLDTLHVIETTVPLEPIFITEINDNENLKYSTQHTSSNYHINMSFNEIKKLISNISGGVNPTGMLTTSDLTDLDKQLTQFVKDEMARDPISGDEVKVILRLDGGVQQFRGIYLYNKSNKWVVWSEVDTMPHATQESSGQVKLSSTDDIEQVSAETVTTPKDVNDIIESIQLFYDE